jgi:hypothetical protein
MKGRLDFFDKLFRNPARLARYPNIRDLVVDKQGRFVDLMTNQQLDDPLRLDAKHVQNKIVLVNFFTLRSEPASQTMARIAQLIKHFGDSVGSDIFINSVTTDPDYDTPKRLAAFAKQLGAPEQGWTMVRAMGDAHHYISSRMNKVRGYTSGREVFYGTPGGFWGTFPVHNAPEVTARRLLDSVPGPKPVALRRAGPSRRGQEKYAWSARDV